MDSRISWPADTFAGCTTMNSNRPIGSLAIGSKSRSSGEMYWSSSFVNSMAIDSDCVAARAPRASSGSRSPTSARNGRRSPEYTMFCPPGGTLAMASSVPRSGPKKANSPSAYDRSRLESMTDPLIAPTTSNAMPARPIHIAFGRSRPRRSTHITPMAAKIGIIT